VPNERSVPNMSDRVMSMTDALDTLTTAPPWHPIAGEEDQVRQAARVVISHLPDDCPPEVWARAAMADHPSSTYAVLLSAALDVAEYRFHRMLADESAAVLS
jgi:hypothetical protein